MYSHNRKEKQELLEYLLGNKEHAIGSGLTQVKPHPTPPICITRKTSIVISLNEPCFDDLLAQEALLLWGDKDRVFPLTFGQQLQRYLKIFIFPNALLLSFCSPVFHFSRFQNDIILLCRYLGPKARLEVLKDAGHAANIDCPQSLNSFIKAFVLHSEGSE